MIPYWSITKLDILIVITEKDKIVLITDSHFVIFADLSFFMRATELIIPEIIMHKPFKAYKHDEIVVKV